MLPGGIFSSGKWENDRSLLHHNEFHHRFYHYLGASGSNVEDGSVNGISCVLSGESTELPEAAAKAFNHWSKISINLHELFNRAPVEAMADVTVALARLAIQAVAENNYPADLAQKVREQAHTILARSAEANRERIASSISEPMRLLESIDGFIMRVQRRGQALSRMEAEAQVRKFLEWCRQLDRALGAIPVLLRDGDANGR